MQGSEPPGSSTSPSARGPGLSTREAPICRDVTTRDSTGIVTAKLLAEKNNPQADVVWGLAGTSLLLLKAEGMLGLYAPTVSATVSRRRQAWLRRCTPRVTRPWRMRTPAEV